MSCLNEAQTSSNLDTPGAHPDQLFTCVKEAQQPCRPIHEGNVGTAHRACVQSADGILTAAVLMLCCCAAAVTVPPSLPCSGPSWLLHSSQEPAHAAVHCHHVQGGLGDVQRPQDRDLHPLW